MWAQTPEILYFFFNFFIVVVVSNVLADLENQYLVLFLLFVMGEGGLSMSPQLALNLQPGSCFSLTGAKITACITTPS